MSHVHINIYSQPKIAFRHCPLEHISMTPSYHLSFRHSLHSHNKKINQKIPSSTQLNTCSRITLKTSEHIIRRNDSTYLLFVILSYITYHIMKTNQIQILNYYQIKLIQYLHKQEFEIMFFSSIIYCIINKKKKSLIKCQKSIN